MSPCCSQAPSLDAANRRLLPAAANRRLLPAAAHWSPPPAAAHWSSPPAASHHLVLPCSCVFQQVQQAIKPQAAAFQSGEKTMQHGESIDDGENTHRQLPRLLARTVCKGKARDVKDLQSTSSSSVNVVRFGSSIGNRAKSKRGGGRTNEKNE
ncbi:hypothetical protein R6Q59_014552 [Mikania micrantha]